MLSCGDADLVRRDTAIPGLRLVLDPEGFAEALRDRQPGATIGTAVPRYARYKPGTNCLVAYRVEVSGQVLDVYAKAYAPHVLDKLHKTQSLPGDPGPLGTGRFVLERTAVAMSVFPYDRDIRRLEVLADVASRLKLLHRLGITDRSGPEGALQVLAYKPERRCVVRWEGPAGMARVIRIYNDAGYAAACQAASALGSGGGAPCISPLLGRSNSRRALAYGWTEGVPMNEVLRQAETPSSVFSVVGATLAALHQRDAPGLPITTPESEAHSLVDAAASLGCLIPRLAQRADTLARRLIAALARSPRVLRTIHGDFNSAQVLLDKAEARLIDLDEAARGEAAMDLGNFRAHLDLLVLGEDLDATRAALVWEAICQGYRDATAKPLPGNLDLYHALGVFRLASHFFRYRDSRWPQLAEAVLARSEDLTDGAVGLVDG